MPEVWGVITNPHQTNVKIVNPYNKYIKNNVISEIHIDQSSVGRLPGGGKFELSFEEWGTFWCPESMKKINLGY